MNKELQQLQNEMNVLLNSLLSRRLLTQKVYNKLCSEYAVKFTKLLATYKVKQSVSFVLSLNYQLPTKAKKLFPITYEVVRDSMSFVSRHL